MLHACIQVEVEVERKCMCKCSTDCAERLLSGAEATDIPTVPCTSTRRQNVTVRESHGYRLKDNRKARTMRCAVWGESVALG
eukprot:6418798-Prymnesium_polylepis.1